MSQGPSLPLAPLSSLCSLRAPISPHNCSHPSSPDPPTCNLSRPLCFPLALFRVHMSIPGWHSPVGEPRGPIQGPCEHQPFPTHSLLCGGAEPWRGTWRNQEPSWCLMPGHYDLSTGAVSDSWGISWPPAQSSPLTMCTHALGLGTPLPALQGCFSCQRICVLGWAGDPRLPVELVWKVTGQQTGD